MNCSDMEYMMPLYLSGELDSVAMAQFERHASGCPACLRQMEEQRSLDRALSQAVLEDDIDATRLRSRVRKEIQKEHRVLPFTRPRWIASAAAAMLICMLGIGSIRYVNERYAQAQADHVGEVVIGRPDHWLTAEADIQKLVAQRVAEPLQAQQLTIPGYQLLRGKVCGLEGHHYVHLVYGNGTQQMSMYLLAGSDTGILQSVSALVLPQIRTRSESGYNVTEGDANGQRILLVGTLTASEQQTIVNDRLHTS